jgi:hypothetical protein
MASQHRIPFSALAHQPGWAMYGVLVLRDAELALQGGRSTALALALARYAGVDVGQAEFWGFLLHDVGMLEMPERILYKPCPLTPAEQDVVGTHTLRSAQLLEQAEALAPSASVALQHHERWDGKGYPRALAGDQILAAARILSVADAYAAMTTPRPYRSPCTPEEAAAVIVDEAGAQFDPHLATAFEGLTAALPPALSCSPPAETILGAVEHLATYAERSQDLGRAQLEAMFATALGLDAEDAATRFGRSTGTQRNWSSSLRRTLSCPQRVPLPRFLGTIGRRVYQAVWTLQEA